MNSSGEQPICDGSDILSPTLSYSRSLPHGLNGMMPTSCMLPGNGKSLEGMMMGEYMVHNSWQEMCQQIPFNSNYSSPDQGWHTVGTFLEEEGSRKSKKLSRWEKRWNSQPSNLAWLSLVIMHDPVDQTMWKQTWWHWGCSSRKILYDSGLYGAANQSCCNMALNSSGIHSCKYHVLLNKLLQILLDTQFALLCEVNMGTLATIIQLLEILHGTVRGGSYSVTGTSQGMDDGWTVNTFPLYSSSLANQVVS